MTHYKQCKLQKGIFHTTSWVPEEFAVTGKYVRLKQEDAVGIKKWDNGWLVVDVTDRTKTEEVYVKRQDHSLQRKANDT